LAGPQRPDQRRAIKAELPLYALENKEANPFVSRALKDAYKTILKASGCDCESDFTASVTPLLAESSAPRLGSYGVVLMLLLLAVS
jgi:hypothetical protein